MKNLKFGKTGILFLILSALVFSGCNFFNSFSDDDDDDDVAITSLTLGKTALSVSVGEISYVSVSVKPTDAQKDVKLSWSYDSSVIKCDTSSSWGVTITGLSEGQTSLRCSYGGYDATCLVTVEGYAETYESTVEPYIYSNYVIIQTAPGIQEKVYVSLYGGGAADIDGYTWTCDNTSVCAIQPTGQYCVITAKDTGYARVKITHPKAAYPYYIGVYSFTDATDITYITTGDNILTMRQDGDEETVTVSLVNGSDGVSDSDFKWELINDGDSCPISYETIGNKAVVTPVSGGSCTLRVTHPDAVYPLDILCRVITVVKNVYINPSDTVVTLSGDVTRTVTCTLENIRDGEYDIGAYEYALDDYGPAEITASVGNQVTLKGKANGSCKLIISHEKAAYAREVLLIVDGQLADAVDASCYITTSQNYIRTKVGADGTYLNVSLKGGEDGDETNLTWTVKSTAADGSGADVVSVDTAHGNVAHSRMAAQTYAYGKAYIEPLAEGTAVITITHPKTVYPTDVLVKVLSADAILEDPLYFAGDGILRIVNGESAEYTVSLRGDGKAAGDDSGIRWEAERSDVRIAAAAATAVVYAPSYGTGETVSSITISHDKADTDKKVMLLTADTQEALDAMKALYSDKLYYNISVGETAYCNTGYVGFDSEDGDGNFVEYDFSAATWTTSDSSVAAVVKSDGSPLTGIVTGLKSGTAKVTCAVTDSDGTGYSCTYTVTVYPEGTVQTEPDVYLTTSQNVITLSGAGKSASAYVTAVNLSASKYSDITWDCGDESVCTVIPNGTSATITAAGEGEAVICVAHPDSQNTLKIYVRVGSEYVIPETEPVVYIASQDVVTMLRDDSPQRLDAVLVNCTDADTSGFAFTIDNSGVAEISGQSAAGIAYVKPLSGGQAEITITHPKAAYPKKVLVVVGNSAEELAGITYLTTGSNVIAVGEGGTKSVSVSVKNSAETVVGGYTWTSSAPEYVSIAGTSGATAVLAGNSAGTAIITVTNSACKYPLQIIAQCVDPIAAAASPYIQLSSSVLTLTVSSSYTSVTADLVGGDAGDYADFIWTASDASVCAVYGQNEVGKLRALKAGQTYVTVSHPKAVYSAQLLVVCDEVKESECYISVPSSIISMKPTDSAQTVTASLINGSSTDKYNFTWSLDVYDVIDFVYSANVCTIEPKQQGQVTITVSHPKAAYDQQIVVTVQEYSEFAFPDTNVTMTQGDVKFLAMEIPNTKVTTHVEYTVANSSVCSAGGTKSTAQLTAVGAGTTTVTARLVASSTGVVQAESELLVYVKEKAVDAVYITSSSTIYTVSKGKSQTLSAILSGTGVTNSDQYNLEWTTEDTDIIQIAGISSSGKVTGQSVYVTALKSGEALITCSHEKAASDLQFYVVVPGSAEKTVTLNKSYMTVVKGGSGSTLKATIENAESSADYYDIEWTVESVGDSEVCRVMGSGQTVTVYPISTGQADVIAQLPDSPTAAKCTVVVEASKSFVFESTAAAVQPFHSKRVKYTVSPPSATLTWTMSQAGDYFSYRDLGCDEDGTGYVEIEGIKEGSGTLVCVTDGGAKGQLSVRVAWDYKFSLSGETAFTKTPDTPVTYTYTVSPVDAEVSVSSTEKDTVFTSTVSADSSDGTGTITLSPLRESSGAFSVTFTATNPNNGDTVGSKTVTGKFVYSSYPVKLKFVGSTGKFSTLRSDGSLVIGDGETVTVNADFDVVSPSKVTAVSISGMSVSMNAGTTGAGRTVNSGTFSCTKQTGGSYVITSVLGDYTEQEYLIKSATVPTYNGEEIFNWMSTDVLYWKGTDKESYPYLWLWDAAHDTYICQVDKDSALSASQEPAGFYNGAYLDTKYGVKTVSTYNGKRYSEKDFRNIAWWFGIGEPEEGAGFKESRFTLADVPVSRCEECGGSRNHLYMYYIDARGAYRGSTRIYKDGTWQDIKGMGGGSNHLDGVPYGIMTTHVNAELVTAASTAVLSQTTANTGTLTVKLSNGKSYVFNVVYEERACAAN